MRMYVLSHDEAIARAMPNIHHRRASFTKIAAPPIPLPMHMLVQSRDASLRRSSARPVTTWRVPAARENMSAGLLWEAWLGRYLLMPSGWVRAMEPPLVRTVRYGNACSCVGTSSLRIYLFYWYAKLLNAISKL